MSYFPASSLSVTAAQISDSTAAGRNVLTLLTPDAGDRVMLLSAGGTVSLADEAATAEYIAGGDTGITETQAPVASVTFVNGIAIAAS